MTKDCSNNLVSVLSRLASREYQRRSWLGEGPEVSSIEELYCQLYDDLEIEIELEVMSLSLPKVADALRILLAAMARADENIQVGPSGFIDPANALDHPDWRIVRESALNVLVAIAS